MKKSLFKAGGLQAKTIRSAGILTALSLILSFMLYYSVCWGLITERAKQLDEMFLQTAVDRANRYLGEIAKIVNIALGDKNLQLLLEPAEESDSSYSRIQARNEYEKHLRSTILNYDQVENFAFLAGGLLTIVYEGVNDDYHTQIRNFYTENYASMEGGTQQFYLLNLLNERKNRIGILSPVFSAENSEPAGCIVAVLGDEFTQQLQFTGDQVYLIDQLGNLSSLKGEQNTLSDGESFLEEELVFPGWKLAGSSFRGSVLKSFNQPLWIFLAAGSVYWLLALAAAYWFNRWSTRPLEKMNRTLQQQAVRKGQRISTRHRKLHFRQRLALFYAVLVAVPALACMAGFFTLIQHTLDQRIGYFLEHRTNFLFDQVDLALHSYRRITVEVAYDTNIQEYMIAEESEKEELESAVSKLLLQKQTQEQGILNISLLEPSGELLYSSFYSRGFIDTDRYGQLIALLKKDPYRLYWSSAYPNPFNRECITLALSVFTMPPSNKAGKCEGYLLLDFDASELNSLLQSFESQGLSRIFLLDETNSPVFPDSIPQWEALPEEATSAILTGKEASGFTLIKKALIDYDMTILTIIPRQEYILERSSILMTFLGIIPVLLLLCFLFSYFSSARLSRSLDSLTRFVRRINSIQFGERFPTEGRDEIEELGNSFNEMLDRLDQLMDQQLEAERQLQNSRLTAKQFELNLLQSQINPHFLYNTLKTIQYMVHVQDPRAEQMIRLLIQLFRAGICRGERLVTVEEELHHITTYLDIQQIRFADKFQVAIEAEPDVRKLYLLKLTLQPIVENAIYHGLELLDRPGHLTIRITAGKDLVVEIEDDGNGMTAEKLADLRQRLTSGESQSIGLLNVHQRIRLHFGEPYGIFIESELHRGTKVTLLFPRIEDPNTITLNGPSLPGNV